MRLDKTLVKRIYRFGSGLAPTATGLGMLQGRYCISNPELEAQIKALSAVYMREHFQDHYLPSSFAEFETRIRERIQRSRREE